AKRVAVLAAELDPLPRAMVPRAHFLPVRRHVVVAYTAEAEEIDFGMKLAVDLERGAGRSVIAAVLGLDGPRLHDAADLLAVRHVTTGDKVLQRLHPLVALLGVERHVQRDELLERVDHAHQQSRNLTLELGDLLDRSAKLLDLRLLILDLRLEEL